MLVSDSYSRLHQGSLASLAHLREHTSRIGGGWIALHCLSVFGFSDVALVKGSGKLANGVVGVLVHLFLD